MSIPSIPNTAAVKKTVRDPRNGLRTSATLATIFTILGHTVFGFEQSVAHVFVALITGYSCAILFEAVDARANGRPPGFAGGPLRMIDFLVSAHMTSITMSFLFYTNTQFWILAFAVAVAIGSKYFFRVSLGGKPRHFMNPSNLGMVTCIVFYQWVVLIPWSLTTDLHGHLLWIVPTVVLFLGLRLNLLYTKRLPLIGSFVLGFVVQAIVRSVLLGNPVAAELALMTNVPLVLLTLYMITDPQTSPSEPRGQVIYGLTVAAAYGLLMAARINFAFFFCVTVAAAGRGVVLYLESLRERGVLNVPWLEPARPVLVPAATEGRELEEPAVARVGTAR